MPTITQALHIINGDTLNNKLRAPDNSVDMMIRLGFSDEQIRELPLSRFLQPLPEGIGAVSLDRRPGIGRATARPPGWMIRAGLR